MRDRVKARWFVLAQITKASCRRFYATVNLYSERKNNCSRTVVQINSTIFTVMVVKSKTLAANFSTVRLPNKNENECQLCKIYKLFRVERVHLDVTATEKLLRARA